MYYGTVSQSENWPTFLCNFVTETFGFEDENDFEYEIWLQLFSLIFFQERNIPESFTLLIVHQKASNVIFTKGGQALFRSQNDKTSTTW